MKATFAEIQSKEPNMTEKPAPDVVEALETWRKAAINLAMREADYRLNHDVHGDGSAEAGRAWDKLRQSGDVVRELACVMPAALQARPDAALAGELEAMIAGFDPELDSPARRWNMAQWLYTNASTILSALRTHDAMPVQSSAA